MTDASLPLLPFYSIVYHEPLGILQCHATRALSAEEVTQSCELLLAAAQRFSCPRWLIDRRADAPGSQLQDLYEWLQLDFFPRVRTAMGASIHVAFLVTPEEYVRVRQYQYAAPLEWHSAVVYINWFANEALAQQWLQAQLAPAPEPGLPHASSGRITLS